MGGSAHWSGGSLAGSPHGHALYQQQKGHSPALVSPPTILPLPGSTRTRLLAELLLQAAPLYPFHPAPGSLNPPLALKRIQVSHSLPGPQTGCISTLWPLEGTQVEAKSRNFCDDDKR